jgi:hypothetical protein
LELGDGGVPLDAAATDGATGDAAPAADGAPTPTDGAAASGDAGGDGGGGSGGAAPSSGCGCAAGRAPATLALALLLAPLRLSRRWLRRRPRYCSTQ